LKIQIQICFDTQKKEEKEGKKRKYWLKKKRKIQYKRLGFFLLLNAIASIPTCVAAAFRVRGIGSFLAVATSLLIFVFAIEWLVRIQRRGIVVKVICGAIRFLIVVLLGICCSGFLIYRGVLKENWSVVIVIGSIFLATMMEYGINAVREHFSEKWCNRFLFISCCAVAVLVSILFGFPGHGAEIVLFGLFAFISFLIPLALGESPTSGKKVEEEEAEMEQPLLSDKTMETTEEISQKEESPNTVITCPACGEMMVVPKSAYGCKVECVCGHKWIWE
jgi:hypothetical protein